VSNNEFVTFNFMDAQINSFIPPGPLSSQLCTLINHVRFELKPEEEIEAARVKREQENAEEEERKRKMFEERQQRKRAEQEERMRKAEEAANTEKAKNDEL
jgi:hypothetical protein